MKNHRDPHGAKTKISVYDMVVSSHLNELISLSESNVSGIVAVSNQKERPGPG
jgi:hypothetical protein